MFYVFLCVTLCPFYIYNYLAGEEELVALLSLSSWCLAIVVWLSLAVAWVYLQFVIVVFPDHNHLIYLSSLFLLKDLCSKSVVGTIFNHLFVGGVTCMYFECCW